MDDIVKEFNKGDPLLASDLTALSRRIGPRGFNRGMHTLAINGTTHSLIDDAPDPGISVFNGEATTVPAFGLVFINGKQDYGDGVGDGYIDIKIKRPDAYGCQDNCLIVDQYGIDATGANSQGYAQIYPPFRAAYDSSDGTPAAGEYWGPRSGSYLLRKNTGGFIVLGPYDTTNHFCLVLPSPMKSFRGQPTADVGAGASGTVTIYTGAYGSEASTGVTMANVKNNSSCTVKGSQLCRCVWDWDSSGTLWEFDVGKTA